MMVSVRKFSNFTLAVYPYFQSRLFSLVDLILFPQHCAKTANFGIEDVVICYTSNTNTWKHTGSYQENTTYIRDLNIGLKSNKLAQICKTIWFYHITKTSLCNEHPLTPHFYIVKLGFTGVYILFLFLL